MVMNVMEKIELVREKLKMAQSRPKSYFDIRKRDLEFNINYWVYLKVHP